MIAFGNDLVPVEECKKVCGNILPTSRPLSLWPELDWGLCPARPAGVFPGAGGREGGDRTPSSPPIPPAPPYRGRGAPPEPDSPVSPIFVSLTRRSPRPSPPNKKVFWRQACHEGARSASRGRQGAGSARGRAGGTPPLARGSRADREEAAAFVHPWRPPRASPRKRVGASAGEAGAPRPRGRWPPRAPPPGAPRAPPAPRWRRVRARGRRLSPAGKLAGARASSSTPGPP